MIRRPFQPWLPSLLILLRVCHWLVIGYAWLLLLQAAVDAVSLHSPELKRKLLPVETTLLALTDPLLAPIRSILRRWTPEWMDPSPFIGILFCIALDIAIVLCMDRLNGVDGIVEYVVHFFLA